MMKPAKILSTLLVIAFLAPWSAPLAHSFSAAGANSEEENHYCVVSKGPCMHGEACPRKELHHKDKHSDHNKAHNTKHTKTERDNTEGSTYLASQCHEGESSVFHASLHLISFALTTTEQTARLSNIDQELTIEDPPLYKNANLVRLEIPPQKSLYQS